MHNTQQRYNKKKLDMQADPGCDTSSKEANLGDWRQKYGLIYK